MDRFVRLMDRISYWAGYLSGLVLMAIILLTMAEVISRYVMHSPLILSDEFGGYALVAVTFLGLAYCGRDNGHIRITFVVERLNPQTASWIRVFTLLLTLGFLAVAAWVSWKFIGDSFTRNMRSNSLLMVPLKWPQMAIPIGFSLFVLVVLGKFFAALGNARAGRPADKFGAEEY